MTKVIREQRTKGEGLKNFSPASYRRNHMVRILPTRGMIPIEIVRSWDRMRGFMNTPHFNADVIRMEVGAAYEFGVEAALNEPAVADWPWIFTYEEDNLQPPDVFHKLFQAMWTCIDCGADMPSDKQGNPHKDWYCAKGHQGLDGISGLYFTKSEPPFPMAFGDPKARVRKISRGGKIEKKWDFRPLDISEAIESEGVVEVNGIAMGCSLFRKDIFRRISRPWFRTTSGAEPEQVGAFTQDLYFALKAKQEIGARFAVHCGVSVGHLDVATGTVY